jgi:predicted RNase H-like nuclease (RuvC/YqgF family)
LTRRLDEPVDRPLEDPRFRDKLFPLSLNEGLARETRNEERLKATIKDLRRDLKRANRQAKERGQLLREFKDRLAGLESTNKRLEELAGAQVLISELKVTLTQRDSENRRLRQENDALRFKEEMRDVRPLRHSA